MKNKTEQELGKGISLLFIAHFFIDQAKNLLQNTKWFKQENKQLLNLLLEKNYYLIEAESKLNKLMSDDKKLEELGLLNSFQGDKDDFNYIYNAEKQIFIHFMNIFLKADDSDIESLAFDLELISKGEKLYQFDIMKNMLLRWNDLTGNKVKYSEEYINEFLSEYK